MATPVQPAPPRVRRRWWWTRGWQDLLWVLGAMSTRAVWFTFVHVLLFLAVYLLGNFQQFLDASLIMLLRMFEVAAALTVLLGAYAIAYLIARKVVAGRLAVGQLIAVAVATGLSGTLALLFKFLRAWFRL